MSKIEVLMFTLIFFLSLTTTLSTEKLLKEIMTNQKQSSIKISPKQTPVNSIPHQEKIIKETQTLTNNISTEETINKRQIPINNHSNEEKIKETETPVNTVSIKTVKPIVGIYLSRYHATKNASEDNIRQKVRYYHSQGFNTILHGVAANGCTYYESNVTQRRFGYTKCPEIHPNEFKSQWLDWLIDEAHKNGMEVHAYFEKGIKLDQNSPIFNLAKQNNWLLPEIDKTYTGIEHYLLDVNVPDVANYYRELMTEFAQKYSNIDAVQWDDYLAYHTEFKSTPEQTAILTQFVQGMVRAIKNTTPSIKFDICHHNPYWAAQYFAADWQKWGVDQVFIQAYNDQNFGAEVSYAEQFNGLAITDNQLHRLREIINNKKINGLLIFPLHNEKSKETAAKVNQEIQGNLKPLW
jgi:uncharacterized lipoprotein YddW (UPF0748 family)